MKGARKWGRWCAAEPSFDKGGQGQVYRVVDSSGELPGTFVLKELLNLKRQARFENEIAAIASLERHPNVIHLIDSGIYLDKRKPFYVMPDADGGSLERTLLGSTHGVTHLLGLFEKILLGVGHIHSRGIIHRDIKPENILMFGGEPRVSDMGLSLISGATRLTPTEEAVGPRYYMAPELEDGRCPDVTPRADMYSLGKVLYCMLSGGKIFARERFGSLEWSLPELYDDERYNLFLPLFRRTIAVSPHDRYATVEELLAAFHDIKESFVQHPGTTLRNKASAAKQSLQVPISILNDLNSGEWTELLSLRRRNMAAFSPEILAAARVSMRPTFAGLLALEALRHESELSHAELVECCCEVVKLIGRNDDAFFTLNENLERIQLLALESCDPIAASTIAKNPIFASREVLKALSEQYDRLDADAKEAFLIELVAKGVTGKERLLLKISRADLNKTMLAMVVAGLMHAATDSTLERIAELLRSSTNVETLNPIIEGIAFKGSKHSIRALLDRDSYSKPVVSMLTLIIAASEESTPMADE
jgi:serine/threonine protein kinase